MDPEITAMFLDLTKQVIPYVLTWVITQYAVRTAINAVTRGKIEV